MKIYKSTIINTDIDDSKVIINDIIIIDKNGIILYCGNQENIPEIFKDIAIVDYSDYFILPGLIDIHNHYPQYPNTGLGTGELLDWLTHFIFPLEAKYDDFDFAYNRAIEYFTEAIKFGTTTIVSYCASSFNSADAAFAAAKDIGINAFLGNAMMDMNSPDSIIKTTKENIQISEKLINKWHDSESGRLQYILTPRFAGACSFDLLKKCGELAKAYNLFIQTHLAENRNELKFIKTLFPDCNNYTDIYLKSGILTEKTLLAHCIYLNNEELKIIKDSGSAICHCPSSNMFLKSGIMPLINYLEAGHKIAIGTDVAAGTSLSMFNEIVASLNASKIYQTLIDSHAGIISTGRAFKHSTSFSADILNISNKCGSISQGKSADLIFINKNRIFDKNISLDNYDILSKIIYSISNNYVDKTMVAGEFLFEQY